MHSADVLFYSQGIVNTGVDSVSENAGVAIATLYSKFKNKNGLVVAYLQARDERWRAVWDAELDRHADGADRVLAIFDALGVWADTEMVTRGCAHSAAANQLNDADHPAMTVVAAHKAHIADRLLELATDAGCPDPAAVADGVKVLYEGLLVSSMLGASPAGFRRLIRRSREVAVLTML